MTVENGAKPEPDKVDAVVVGAGPAGLMAAEVLSKAGRRVIVLDAMPSVGRKFLMAGKSGLNLTKSASLDAFLAAYPDAPVALVRAVHDFGPEDAITWARGLGIPVFTGSTGRVFPDVMKASPLLRAWLARLAGQGVKVRSRWRWTGWDGGALVFDTPGGTATLAPRVAIFALGGASWRRLGSDGEWADGFRSDGHPVRSFVPANVGFRVTWSDHMAPHFGTPVKGTRLTAGTLSSRGEWVVSSAGVEGGGIYEVSRTLREGAPLTVDLMPDLMVEQVGARLARPRGKASLGNHLRKTLNLTPAQRALLMEWGRPLPESVRALAHLIKTLPAATVGPLPIDGAISTSGGLDWGGMDGFRLKARSHSYAAGEMLDWEAPTGGYLITACLATGRAAARQALDETPSE